MGKILEVKNLTVHIKTHKGVVQAVRGVDFYLNEQETLAVVGESGSGKSITMKGVMGILPKNGKVVEGSVMFQGNDLTKYSERQMQQVRGSEIAMIFQDPMTSLNPTMKVGKQIEEVFVGRKGMTRAEVRERALEILRLVGINEPERRYKQYPHELSGGMKQRVIIAIALACQPKLLIADEPTTALDVTIQAQVLDLIQNLKKRDNTSMLLITHDLGVVAQTCDYVAIMYAGEIVEYGTLREVYKDIRHPYTKGLMASIPNLVEQVERLQAIDGLMPDPTNLAKGCKFADRCKYATAACMEKVPEMKSVGGEHMVRCILPEATEVKEH